MKTRDPLITATKRIRRRTTLGRLELLLAERAKAKRRLTLALSRLDRVERELSRLALEQARATFTTELEAAQ